MERSGRRAKTTSRIPGPPADLDPREFAAAVGEAIRTARQGLGWTQVQLAEAARLSANYVARLERGELGPSFFVAHQICEALRIDVETLLAPPTRVRKHALRR
jgi:transcriptional regulator with XRE-family HTH domain